MRDNLWPVPVPVDRGVFDDGKTLSDIIAKSFAKAANDAMAKNDRLGIMTHGGRDGKLSQNV